VRGMVDAPAAHETDIAAVQVEPLKRRMGQTGAAAEGSAGSPRGGKEASEEVMALLAKENE
jgi:hypothetical protein